MKYLTTYFAAILLSVFGLGLLVPVSATAHTTRDASPYFTQTEAESFERGDNAPITDDIEISILHGSTPIEIVPPRIIYSELDLDDYSKSDGFVQ